MKENFLELYSKLKTYRAAVLSATFFVFLCFGIMLVTNTISIDEHIAIFSRSYNDPFLAYGRFGIRLFYILFAKFGKYAPLYFDVFTLIFIILSAFVFYITLFKKNTSPLYCFLFISYYCSIPFVFANFMSFSQQSLPISIGMFFISLVIYFIDTKKPLLVPCSLLLFISFSFYLKHYHINIIIIKY